MTISINSETTGGSSGNVFTVSKPSTVSDNDLLVVIIGCQAFPTVTPPPGWILIGSGGTTTGNDTYIGVFCRYIGLASEEPSSYNFTSSLTAQYGYWVASLSTTSQHINLDQAISFANRQDDTSPNTPAQTTVSNDAFAFAAWAVNNDNATDPPAGGWNTRADNVGGNGVLTVSSQTFATAGTSTGTPEITNVAASQDTETAMIVFRDGASPANRATNIGAGVEYVADEDYTRLTDIGVEVEYVADEDYTRLTDIGVEIEYVPQEKARTSQIGFQAEYKDAQELRLTNVGFQVEYTPGVSDNFHTHIADNVALTQHNVLVVQDGYHTHIADNISFVTTLVVQDGYHVHKADTLWARKTKIFTTMY